MSNIEKYRQQFHFSAGHVLQDILGNKNKHAAFGCAYVKHYFD